MLIVYILNFLSPVIKCLSKEKSFDILNGSDKWIIRDSGENDSSEETDEYEDDITAADALVDEEKVSLRRKAKVILLATVAIATLYLEGVHNYHGEHKLFSGNYVPHCHVENILETVFVIMFLLS